MGDMRHGNGHQAEIKLLIEKLAEQGIVIDLYGKAGWDYFIDLFESADPVHNGGGYWDLIAPAPSALQTVNGEQANQNEHSVVHLIQLASTARGSDMTLAAGDPLSYRTDLPSAFNNGEPVPGEPVMFYAQSLLDQLNADGDSLTPAQMMHRIFEEGIAMPVLLEYSVHIAMIFLGQPGTDPGTIPENLRRAGVNVLSLVVQAEEDETQSTGYRASQTMYLNGVAAQTEALEPYDPSAPNLIGQSGTPEFMVSLLGLPYWGTQKYIMVTKAHTAVEVTGIYQRIIKQVTV